MRELDNEFRINNQKVQSQLTAETNGKKLKETLDTRNVE